MAAQRTGRLLVPHPPAVTLADMRVSWVFSASCVAGPACVRVQA
jgi:hypothetical protein